MKKFNVGEKVVALTNPFSQFSQPRVKGRIYPVLAVKYCSACGKQTINVSGKSEYISGTGCDCGEVSKPDDLWWTSSEYFARPSELQAELEQAEMEQRYEDCADLVGIMAELEINKENVNQ